MVGKLLMRGMLAGIAAGLLTFGFAKIVGEPQVDQAISFEENRSRPRRSTGTRTGQPSRKPASVC